MPPKASGKQLQVIQAMRFVAGVACVVSRGMRVTSAAEAEAEGGRGQDLRHEEQKGREAFAYDVCVDELTRNHNSSHQHPLMLFTGCESAAVR